VLLAAALKPHMSKPSKSLCGGTSAGAMPAPTPWLCPPVRARTGAALPRKFSLQPTFLARAGLRAGPPPAQNRFGLGEFASVAGIRVREGGKGVADAVAEARRCGMDRLPEPAGL
jgi:hypothetical protein